MAGYLSGPLPPQAPNQVKLAPPYVHVLCLCCIKAQSYSAIIKFYAQVHVMHNVVKFVQFSQLHAFWCIAQQGSFRMGPLVACSFSSITDRWLHRVFPNKTNKRKCGMGCTPPQGENLKYKVLAQNISTWLCRAMLGVCLEKRIIPRG